MELSAMYQVSKSEKVIDAEKDLKKDLTELKSELEENEMVHGIPMKTISSVPLPRDVDYFQQERKQVINRIFQVSEAAPLKCQADIMKEELITCESTEYSIENLPLLLHQHFADRLQQLVQCKHLHMLRWKRFCEHTSTIEALYPVYQQRLAHILAEYEDCLERAQRLSVAREAHLAGKDFCLPLIQPDDMLIYLRWLVCHLHSCKKFHQYLRVLQWLAVTHKNEICPIDDEEDKEEGEDLAHVTKIASRYQDDVLGLSSRPGSGISRPTSSRSSLMTPPVPAPPPLSTALLSTQPLPSHSAIYAAAATGGGLASDEHNLQLPLHVMDFHSLRPHLAFFLNIYGINYDLDSIHNTADEMEMYAAINRKFKYLFYKQEHMKTFRMYDRIEVGQEGYGSESSQNAFKQDCNWLPFINIKPETDGHQEKQLTILKQNNNIDPLLKDLAHFIHVQDVEKVQDTMRAHAMSVRDPPSIHPASVTTHPTSYNTASVWKKIYSNPSLYTTGSKEDDEVIDLDDDYDSNYNTKNTKNKKKRRDSYDYKNTVQMLGLDEGEENDDGNTSVPGAFLSFLHLRHIRIRDLQRTCLSVLNYFRSIERTLTINDGGLSHDSGSYQKTSAQGHRVKTESDGTQGGGGGINYHGYLHNTPADYKVNESEFIQYTEIENHDNFYSIEEGRVHVQDQRGYYIMYEQAIQDLEEMEKSLLLVASHYINKDKELRLVSRMKINESVRLRSQTVGDFDIPTYAHQEVDRIGILLDLWSNEAAFIENKRELLDCYYEAYQHVYDRDEKRALAQVMTDIIYRRPRYDFTAPYFIQSYRTESIILHHSSTLVKNILDKQIEEEREYIQRVCRDGDDEFGLPYRIIPKQPISVNLTRSALKNVFMLEFHPTLSIASRIPQAIKYSLTELIRVHKPATVQDKLLLEKKLLEVAQKEFRNLGNMGASYTPQIQKDLYSDVFAEDPLFICEIAQSLVSQKEQVTSRSTKDKQMTIVNAYCQVMETVTLRHRLMDSAWESEILAKVYRSQAKELEFEDYHMFLRFVQFEFAVFKEDAGKPPPIFITAIQEDDTSVDRYVPSSLYLAIHELDEGHVGRFSFRSRDGFMQILRPGGVKSLQVILKAQVVHKNSLVAAVQQTDICHPVKYTEWKSSGRLSPTETKSEKSSVTQMTSLSLGQQNLVFGSKSDTRGKKIYPEAFISLQCEKAPSRDLMLNEFVSKRQQMGVILKNPEELETLKRKLISVFCERFHLRVAQYSLRAQLIQYYQSIISLLEEFPNIRDTYFVMGELNEKKTSVDDIQGVIPDSRTFKSRPRQLLSSPGKDVLNIWFIPHHSEVLILFKSLDDEHCMRALHHSLSIVSALHDILQYLCAHSRLGSSHARLGSRKLEFVSADWGGTEGIGSELREIQKQINNLNMPTDPKSIGEFLALRRDVMFLEFDTAVRYSMADTFIATGNIPAFRAVNNNTYHALPSLSSVQKPSLFNTQLVVPEPLEPRDSTARILFPWRSFLGRNGAYPVMYDQWDTIEYNIQLCLSGLKDVDRHIANGEILGVSLLMEDVLQHGMQDNILIEEPVDSVDHQHLKTQESKLSHYGSISRASSVSGKDLGIPQSKTVSRNQQPLEAYKLLKFFLKLWKCLEILKYDWGKRRVIRPCIDNTRIFKEYSKLYRTEILLPVLQSIARRLGQGDIYEGLALHTDILTVPKGASEVEVKAKQMVRLLENLECHMINEVRKKLGRELSLALAERCREESNLPTDIWKKPVMKESFTIRRPYVGEHFAEQLLSEVDEKDDVMIFKKEHFEKCLTQLYREINIREKHCFESYSMYYENLLKVHHQLLYHSEQEVKQLKDQLKSCQNSTVVDVQCQLAEEAHDLLMEVTALRSKISEMREESLTQERDIRERVKEDYDDLVKNLYDVLFKLRQKYDEYRNEMTDDMFEKISETRREAVEKMSKLKHKVGAAKKEDTLKVNLDRAEQLRELQHENFLLNALILKMKTMSSWKHNHTSNNFIKAVSELRKNSEKSTYHYIEKEMLAEEETILLKQQLASVKKSLKTTEKECNEIRKQLDKELKVKSEQAHAAIQKERSKQQLEKVNSSNIEKLREEVIDKELRLKILSEEQERNNRIQQLSQEKTRKDVMNIKKQLQNERLLKTDAFQTVDDLQSQLYDYETAILRRSNSLIGLHSSLSGKSRSRATSAGPTRGPPSRTTNSTSLWPPSYIPANRSLTPAADHTHNNNLDKKIQRPKTTGGRLRSKIAEQLLNDLDPETQRSIIQLEELNYHRKDKTF